MCEDIEEVKEKLEVINHNKFLANRIAVNRIVVGERVVGMYMMIPVDEKTVQAIDKLDEDSFVKLGDFTVTREAIKVYGEVDLRNKTDVDGIKKLLSKANDDYHYVPRGYDYETNTSLTSVKGISFIPTIDYVQAFRYYHACIGKPTNIAILKLSTRDINARKV